MNHVKTLSSFTRHQPASVLAGCFGGRLLVRRFSGALIGFVIAFLAIAMSTPASAQTGTLKMEENFSYTSATLLTANGWSAHSSAGTNPQKVASSGLTYSGYASSGIGNAASFIATGEDVNKTFASAPSGVASGSLYYSVMFRIDTARIATGALGDYGFHLYKNSTAFSARVFFRRKSSDATKYSIGISRASTASTISYSDSIYSTGTTYLLVMKYVVVSGVTNDSIALWVNPTLGVSETTPTVFESATSRSSVDIDTVYGVAYRQGGSTQGASGLYDGIRVGTTWEDVTASPAAPTATTGVATSITTTTATLNGTVNANWLSTTETFDYGTTLSYGSTAAATQNPIIWATTTAVSAAITGLTPNQLYHFRDPAVNSAGSTSGSDATFTTLPAAPTTTAATSVMTTTFDANWTAGAGNAPSSYELDVSDDPGFSGLWTGFPATGITGTSYNVTLLTPGTTFYYRVRAVGSASTSANSNTTSQITVPNAPVATAATSVSTTSFDANWGSATGAASYRLDVATDAGFTSLVSGYSNLTVAGLTQSVTGLNPNTAYHYRVRAVNAGGTSSNSNTIMATTTCPTITVGPASFPNGQNGISYSQTATASGGTAAYTFAVTSGALPTGLSLASGGLVSGTPSANGTFIFGITATDAFGCTGAKTDSITITSCPVLSFAPPSLPNASGVGASYSQTVTASGGTSPYSYAVTSGALPGGLLLNTSTGEISGTVSGSAGTFTFDITATDSTGCTGVKSYSIVVCPNITISTLVDGTIGVAYSQSVTASGGTTPYIYAVTGGALPTGLSMSGAGSVTGIPTALGSFNYTVTATDSNGCTGSRTDTVDIVCPVITITNPAPDGNDGVAYSHTYTPSGGTAGYSYAITSGVPPTGLSLSAGGTLSGIPSGTGTSSFDVTVTDTNGCTGVLSESVTIGTCPTITLGPASPLPAGTQGTVYSQTVTASGGAPAYTFAITAGSLPPGLSLASGGGLTGIPTLPGAYSFTVTATDANGCTGSKVYSLTINCPTLTVSNAPNGTISVAYSHTYTTSGGTPAYSYAVTGGTLPTSLTLTPGGLLSGIPSVGGTYIFTVQATDANLCTGSRLDTVVIVSPALFMVAGPSNVPDGPMSPLFHDTLGWNSPSTWVIVSGGDANGIPDNNDDVILDNTYKSGSYVVTAGVTKPDSCRSILVGGAGASSPIVLLIPKTSPLPGLGSNRHALTFGNNLPGNYDAIIDNNGTVDNAYPLANSNRGFNILGFGASGDSVLIKTGGRYIHRTRSSVSGIAIGLSKDINVVGGTFEFDVPKTGTNFFVGFGGIVYPSLVLSATDSALTYNGSSSSAAAFGSTFIKGNLIVNAGANLRPGTAASYEGDFFVRGNIVNNGTIDFSSATQNILVFMGPGAQTVSGNALTLGKGLFMRNAAGVTLATNLNVSGGSVTTTGTMDYLQPQFPGNVFTITAAGVLTTGSSSIVLNPNGSMNEGTNAVQGNVSATRTALLATNQTFGNIGAEINAAGGAPGSTVVTRKTGDASIGNSNVSIKRYFDITPTNNSALNATFGFSFVTTELNGITEADLLLQKSTDGGTSWSGKSGTINLGLHKITANGVNGFSRWTAASANAPLFITHTITIRKLKDDDGNPNTTGDQLAKKWRLSLYRDSVSAGTLINSQNFNSGIMATNNLEAGTYIACEEDSLGWLRIGRVHNGTTIADGSRYDTITVSGSNPGTVDFINQQVSSLTVYKFKDTDGNPNTIEGATSWHLSIYRNSISPANLVTEGTTAQLTATGLQAGTYIICEADSGASWVRLNGNGTRYDTLVILANTTVADTFINFRPNSITVRKFQDNDGNFATSGDRVAKPWHLAVTPGGSGSTGTYTINNLGDGNYTVSEADSAGWIHLGYVEDGTPVASNSNNVVVSVANGQAVTVDFVNAPPIYSAMFRSFSLDSITVDKDNKGKVGKFVKRKADKVEVKLVITAPDSATGFTVKFSMPFTGVIYTDITKSIVLDSITNVKEKIVTTSVDPLETFQIDGFGHKGKQITTSVIWATLPRVTKVDYKLPAQYLMNQPRLPMPNRINVMFETFGQGGFTSTLGLPVGLPRADSVKAYGWLVAPKYTDALKSMVDKTGAQSGPASNFGNYVGGKPVLKAQKSLPPAKFNNRLFGDLIALKLNIAASALGKTPVGFGELLYNDGSNALDGMMIRDIATLADSMMSARSYAALFPSKSSYESSIGYANLDSIVKLINSAFEAAMDTVSPEGFTTKLTVAGARTLASVLYLKANPSVAAARITPLVTRLSQTPDAYALLQNYPNPFNPTTTIQFDLPEEALVTLKVYNLLGQEVATLFDHQQMEDGTQEVTFDASSLSSGVYFYRIVAAGVDEDGLTTNTFSTVKKMMLIK